MRLRNDPQAIEKLKQSQFLIDKFPWPLNSQSIVELGMGKGEMLTQLATLYPEKLFIGVEKFPTVAYKAAQKAAQLKINNFKIICGDVINLKDYFSNKTDTIWLTFSDPWPKKRHHKRRLTHPAFLAIYADILSSKGKLKLKTDNDQFFAYSQQMLIANNWKIIYVTTNLHNDLKIKDNVMTDYEKKWQQKGKNINFLEASPPFK